MKTDPFSEPIDEARNDLGVGESTRPTDDLAKDELNLLEYPLSLVANRVPQRQRPDGTWEPVKTIEYTDWVHQNGERRPQRWLVTGSDAYGLPTGPDNDVLLALIEAARKRGFKDRNISLNNAYEMLKSVGHTGGKNYERFSRAIPRWATLNVSTENALWDRKGRRYVSRQGFNLFQGWKLTERERPTAGPQGGKREPIFWGYLTMSDYLFNALRDGNVKDLDLAFYRTLPNPLTKKLYRYLDKKRYFGPSFSIGTVKLCLKLGFHADAVATYKPAKIRNLLRAALDELKTRGFLVRHTFRHTKNGDVLTAYYTHAGTRVASTNQPRNPFGLNDHQLALANLLAEDIAQVCGDAERNAGHYFKTGAEAVRDGNEHLIHQALSETKAADVPYGTVKNRSAYFTHVLEAIRPQLSLPLTASHNRPESDAPPAAAPLNTTAELTPLEAEGEATDVASFNPS